jgi:flagellar biogenesis protein FliO
MSLAETQLPSLGWFGRMVAALFRVAHPRNRQLHLAEVLSLGERRFVALIECDQRRFLIGSTPQSIRLLTEIEGHTSATRVIGKSRFERERTQ